MKNLINNKEKLLQIEDFQESQLSKQEELNVVGGIRSSAQSSCFTSGSPLGCDGTSVCLSSCFGGSSANIVNIGGVTYILQPVKLARDITGAEGLSEREVSTSAKRNKF